MKNGRHKKGLGFLKSLTARRTKPSKDDPSPFGAVRKVKKTSRVTNTCKKIDPFVYTRKGERNGFCNRSNCLSPDSVVWFNSNTQKYYCPACASTINYWSNYDEGIITCSIKKEN